MRPVLLVPVLLLAACGGGNGPSVESGRDVADMIGCKDFKSDDSTELFVTESGFCQLDGKQVAAYYFATNDDRDSYVKAAAAFGGEYLVGDHWVVSGKPDTLGSLADKVGGEVKP